jgi:hypothetical protein
MTSSNLVGACTGRSPGFARAGCGRRSFPARASSARTTSSGLRAAVRIADMPSANAAASQVAFNRRIRIEDDGDATEARCDLLAVMVGKLEMAASVEPRSCEVMRRCRGAAGAAFVKGGPAKLSVGFARWRGGGGPRVGLCSGGASTRGKGWRSRVCRRCVFELEMSRLTASSDNKLA